MQGHPNNNNNNNNDTLNLYCENYNAYSAFIRATEQLSLRGLMENLILISFFSFCFTIQMIC